MKCDIIIPVWNQLEFTRVCVENIIKNTKYPYRLIIVDNASGDDARRYLEGLKDRPFLELELIRNEENTGFVKAVNQGLRISSAPYVCILNNDTVPGPDWLDSLIRFVQTHKETGLVNPLCNGHGDMSIEEYAKKVSADKDSFMEMNQCQGFCMLIKREVIDSIGYLDEAFGMGCYDDTDYSRRAWEAGYRCASVHSSYVYHRENASFDALGKRRIFEKEGEKAYLKKWPRHFRIAFAVRGDSDEKLRRALDAALYLAREWCWVNIFIFGDRKFSKDKVVCISRKIGMPRHQNIKFNFLSERFAALQLLIRVIERSFGPKSRKRYDIVFTDDNGMSRMLKLFRFFYKTRVLMLDSDSMKRALLELYNSSKAACRAKI